jgi:hypothetical protein
MRAFAAKKSGGDCSPPLVTHFMLPDGSAYAFSGLRAITYF